MSMPKLVAASFLLCVLATVVQADTHDADAAYLQLFAAASGAEFSLNWSRGSDPCDHWVGLNCNGNGKVLQIDLAGRGLRGSVPAAKGSDYLDQLTYLDLRGNGLTGDLPELLLPSLTHLYLDDNFFTSVPPGFFADMMQLDTFTMRNNTQVRRWSLPGELRNLTGLTWFDASSAGVNGSLPEYLGSSSPLFKLLLANNSLSGPVPAAFESDTIDTLDLSNNNFSGQLTFLVNLSNIIFARLNNNGFTGPLPDFREYVSMQEFNVAHNRLTGIVPATLPKRLDPGSSSVSLAGNLLQGPVPQFASSVRDDAAEAAEAGCFCRLDPGPCDPVVDSLLSIAGALHSPVILAASWRRNDPCAGWIGVHCSAGRKVVGINLSRLALNGTMDPAFGSISSLEAILLSGNEIAGSIPPAIAHLPSLRILDVSNNALQGRVPRFRRDVEVWSEGNRGLYSVAPPIIKPFSYLTLFLAILAFAA